MRIRGSLIFGAGVAAGLAALPVSRELFRSDAFFTQALAAEGNEQAGTYHMLDLFGYVFEKVRDDYVHPVSASVLVDNALKGMVSGLDPHSAYLTRAEFNDRQSMIDGRFGGVGLDVEEDEGVLKVVAPIDGTPAARARLRPGDLILGIDGKSVDGMTLEEAVDRMKGDPGTRVMVTIKRIGVNAPLDVRLTRETIHVPTVKSALYGRIGYIRLSEFDAGAASGVASAWRELQSEAGGRPSGLILDLRDDPGGLLDQAVAVGSDFIGRGEIVSTRARHPEDSQRWDANASDITGGAPIVVLIDGGTASASEIVAGALQDHGRAVLLGTRSFGKGSVQTLLPVGDDGGIVLTTALYYTPSGRSIQDTGITPDIVIDEERGEKEILPDREADLLHALRNEGGVVVAPRHLRRLPPIAASLPGEPPASWPALDPSRPSTDFQLQEAIKLVRDMAPLTTAAQ